MGALTNFVNFYNKIWNVNTAVDFGLDIWGKIVVIGRLLQLPSSEKPFGFFTGAVPSDTEPFGGGTFSTGSSSTQSYRLEDDAYRALVLTKALANIASMDAPTLNSVLRNLFPGRGRCYTQDLGGMRMRYVFEFPLSQIEYAILSQESVPPSPTGVAVDVLVVDVAGILAFSEAGYGQTFGHGTFYKAPT